MPAILRSVYNYKTPKTPREVALQFPNESQTQVIRQVLRIGIKQVWDIWGGRDKKNFKSSLKKLDYFLEKTGKSVNPSFESIVADL